MFGIMCIKRGENRKEGFQTRDLLPKVTNIMQANCSLTIFAISVNNSTESHVHLNKSESQRTLAYFGVMFVRAYSALMILNTFISF